MANRLKNLTITSVDLCKQGANPEAHIRFYKSADEEVKDMEFRTEEMTNFVKSILENLEETKIIEIAKDFEKDLLNNDEKEEEMAKGFVIDEMEEKDQETLKELMKKYKVGAGEEEKPNKNQEENKEDKGIKKSMEDEISEIKKSLEIVKLAKSFERFIDLGKDIEEIAKKYVEMKSVNEDIAKEYIAALDEQLKYQEESGIFKKFGKSGETSKGWESIETVAKKLVEEGKVETKEMAIAKACELHPELVKEYEEELNEED